MMIHNLQKLAALNMAPTDLLRVALQRHFVSPCMYFFVTTPVRLLPIKVCTL